VTDVLVRGTVVIDVERRKGCELCIPACPPPEYLVYALQSVYPLGELKVVTGGAPADHTEVAGGDPSGS
jgi:hypothetical protein